MTQLAPRHSSNLRSASDQARDEGDLPVGWHLAKLGDLATKVGSGATPRGGSEAYHTTGIPLVRSMNVRFEGFTPDGLAFLNDDQAAALREATIQSVDVLLNITGASIGRVTQAPNEIHGARVNQHVCIIRTTPAIDGTFLSRYLSSPSVQEMIWTEQYGVTRQALTKGQILAFDIPIPPLAEQRRIVTKLEELLGKVSSSQQRLSRVPSLLKRFRQSVLAAACSGRLTADWRETNAHLESAPELLKRVLIERFDLWCDVAAAKARADGRILQGDSWKSRYESPIALESDGHPEIPETWRWTSFDTFAASFQYGPRFGENEYTADGIPTVRTSDMNYRGEITLNSPPRVVIPTNAKDHFLLRPDDLVITRTGATIGKCALYEAILGPMIASAYLIRYRLTRTTTSSRFLLTVLMSPWGQQQLLGGITAVAQPNVNTTTIAKIPIPLPPLAEQQEIVRRVESLLSFADQIEARLRKAQTHVDRLTQSILARAFRGELVPTEAELARREGRDYEPASALLARIKATPTTEAKPPHRRARAQK